MGLKAGLKLRRKTREKMNKKQLEVQKKMSGMKKKKGKGKWMRNLGSRKQKD